MWPALIRGSVFSSIRSSALLPSDHPSDDILASPSGNLTSSINIQNNSDNSNNNNDNDNDKSDFDYNINKENGSTTAATDSLEKEIPPPARRCEMLSIKELTSNDSSPDSSLSHPSYSSWEASRTSPPLPDMNSTSSSTLEQYMDTEHTYTYMDRSLTASEQSHDIMDKAEKYHSSYHRHHDQRYRPPHRHHQDYDHHPLVYSNHWHDKDLEQATSAATSSIITKLNTSANVTPSNNDNGLSESSLLVSVVKGFKTRTKRSTSSSSSTSAISSSSSLSSSSNEDDHSQTTTATENNDNNISSNSNGGDSKRKAQNMDDRPFACPLCERRFNRRYNLNAHIRIHDPHRKKLFDCSVCTQSFDRKHDRDRHVDALHFENKRRALCHLCDASFTRRDALTRHVHKLHTRSSS